MEYGANIIISNIEQKNKYGELDIANHNIGKTQELNIKGLFRNCFRGQFYSLEQIQSEHV